jgi:hypothetical protein
MEQPLTALAARVLAQVRGRYARLEPAIARQDPMLDLSVKRHLLALERASAAERWEVLAQLALELLDAFEILYTAQSDGTKPNPATVNWPPLPVRGGDIAPAGPPASTVTRSAC